MGELINTDAIQLFEDKKIRTAWDEEQEGMVLFHCGRYFRFDRHRKSPSVLE